MSVRNNNWYNLNSTRAYPLSDAATGTADDGSQLPNDIVVDLTLRFPPEAGKYAYIGAVTVTRRLVTVLIMAANTPDGDGGFVPLASITLQKPVVPHVHYPLEARYPGVGGFIVFENTDAVYTGRFSTPAQSLIAPKCAGQDRNLPIPNIRKLGRDIGLTGLVTIKAGTDMEIVRESVLIGSTSTEALVLRLLDTPGRNVLADYIGPCGERPESRNCGQDAIESINEAVPDCNGNINFEFVNLTPAPYEDCGPGILLDQGIGLTDVCTAQEVQRFKGTLLCDPIVLPQHSISLSSFPSISESDVSLSSEVITCASLPWCENFDLETAEFFKVKEGVFVFEFTDSPGESCPGGIDAFSSVMLSSGAIVFVSGSSCSFTSNTSEAFSSQGSTLSSAFVDVTSSYSSLDSSFDSDYSSECTGCEEDSLFGYSFESWSSESAGSAGAPVVTLSPVLKPWHRHTVLCPGCVEESLSGASEAIVPGTNDAIQRLTWSNESGTLNTDTVDAVQKIMLANTGSQPNGTQIADSGNWTMVVDGHETYSISWGVTAALLENALTYAGISASVKSYKYDGTLAAPLSADDGFYLAGNYFLVTFGRVPDGLASTGANTITLYPSGPDQAVVVSTQVVGASSTWTLTWNGRTSYPIAADVNATTLRDTLAANVYGIGNVTVTIPAGTFNNGSPRYAQLNFTGSLAGIAVALPTLTYSLNPTDTVITASDVQVGGGAGASETVIWHQHNVTCIELFTSLTSDSSEGQLWPDHDTRLVQRTHYHTRLADIDNPGYDCYFWYDVHLEAHMHHYTKTVQEKEIVHVPGAAGSPVVKTSVEHCVPTSTRTVNQSTHRVAVPYIEHPAVSYAAISGASRNVSVWDACAYSNSLNMQIIADLQILGDLNKHNGGLVLNYHLVTPLTNPHVEYFLVLLDQDSSSLRIYRYTGTGLVLVNTFSTSSIVRGDWYRMRVQISAFSPTQTIIQGSVRGVSDPTWPAVSFSTITSLLLPADGLYGVGTDRSHTRFSYFQIQELP